MPLDGDELSTLTKLEDSMQNNNWKTALVFGIVSFVVGSFAWTYVSGQFTSVEQHEGQLKEHDLQLRVIETQYAEIIRRLERIERKN